MQTGISSFFCVEDRKFEFHISDTEFQVQGKEKTSALAKLTLQLELATQLRENLSADSQA